MLPYFVDDKTNSVDLYQLPSNGKFQFQRYGAIGLLLVGHDYVVFEEKVASRIEQLNVEGIEFKESVIWDRRSDTEYLNYREALIANHFNSDTINQVKPQGLGFYLMDKQYLFVSPELKTELENLFVDTFTFTEGLASFV